MIEVKHNGKEILDLYENGNLIELYGINKKLPLINQLYFIAAKYPNEIIIWYHNSLKPKINTQHILKNFENYMMWSYTTLPYINHQIGYVEDSPFINVNKTVKYPTWLMRSSCGVIHSEQLLKFQYTVNDKNFDFALNSIAKLGMSVGLWCYSEPQILSSKIDTELKPANIFNIYRFIALHYKKRWVVLFFINLLIYEKRLTILGFIYGLLFKKRNIDFTIQPNKIDIVIETENSSIDIIIPTIGRKKYLYNFLQDLKTQSLLPVNVIIIEQNPDKASNSDLDYIHNEIWPFNIVHKFIHRTGACNARNMALNLVTSNYVFLADDDIRIEDKALLQNALSSLEKFNVNVLNLACLQQNEIDQTKVIKQWGAFGSGCSILLSSAIKHLKFNMALEHGYGEDVDFGMRLRNIGEDIVYMPHLKLLHLKAPVGGFRKQLKTKTNTEENQVLPKPSPSVMLFRKLHHTKAQLLGYKTILFIKYYKLQHVKNPIIYLKRFRQSWGISESMAKALSDKN